MAFSWQHFSIQLRHRRSSSCCECQGSINPDGGHEGQSDNEALVTGCPHLFAAKVWRETSFRGVVRPSWETARRQCSDAGVRAWGTQPSCLCVCGQAVIPGKSRRLGKPSLPVPLTVLPAYHIPEIVYLCGFQQLRPCSPKSSLLPYSHINRHFFFLGQGRAGGTTQNTSVLIQLPVTI